MRFIEKLKRTTRDQLFPGITQDRYRVHLTEERMNRILFFHRLLEQIKDIPGAIAECGIGWGYSFQIFALLSKRDLWGFDSFEGYPEPTEEDTSYRNAKKGQFHFMEEWNLQEALKTLWSDKKIPLRVIIKKGFFKDTLPKVKGQIAFLRIDCDLYESHKQVLEYLYPLVESGGVVTLDEYLHTGAPGAKKAIEEYFGDNLPLIQYDSIVDISYFFKP